jgi:tRNA nucleotidyltransferase (CCA-adding enzyme)
MAANMASVRSREQLGMIYATASNRLVKDILFSFAVRLGYKCWHCGKDLSREDFTVEHKVPWLDSADPKALFFDLDNIHFSHLLCNTGAARRCKKFATEEERIAHRRVRNAAKERRLYTPERRRKKYLRTGY